MYGYIINIYIENCIINFYQPVNFLTRLFNVVLVCYIFVFTNIYKLKQLNNNAYGGHTNETLLYRI